MFPPSQGNGLKRIHAVRLFHPLDMRTACLEGRQADMPAENERKTIALAWPRTKSLSFGHILPNSLKSTGGAFKKRIYPTLHHLLPANRHRKKTIMDMNETAVSYQMVFRF